MHEWKRMGCREGGSTSARTRPVLGSSMAGTRPLGFKLT